MGLGKIIIRENPVKTGLPLFLHELKPHEWERYNHEVRAMGGYWKASFSMFGGKVDLEEFFSEGLNREMRAYLSDGRRVFEGYINTMKLHLPGISAITSLDSFWSRVRVRYDTGAAQAVSMVFDLDAINKYGDKTLVLSAGRNTAARAAQIGNTILLLTKIPRRTRTQIRSRDENKPPRIEVSVNGYIHTLWWEVHNATTAGVQNANLVIQDIVNADCPFVASMDLDTNTTQIPRNYSGADRRPGDIIFDIARHGDASYNRWIVAMYDNRKLIYKAAESPELTNVYYHYRMSDPRKTIKDHQSRELLASELRPDRWLRIEDIFPYAGQQVANLYDDPQVVYVEGVKFREPNEFDITGGQQAFLDFLQRKAAMGNVAVS